jgi:hypothetical protein
MKVWEEINLEKISLLYPYISSSLTAEQVINAPLKKPDWYVI